MLAIIKGYNYITSVLCTVEDGSLRSNDLAMNPVAGHARTAIKPAVRACAQLVWQENQHTLSIVQMSSYLPS